MNVEQDTFREKKCKLMTRTDLKPVPRAQALSTLSAETGWSSDGTPTSEEEPYIKYDDDDETDGSSAFGWLLGRGK